MKTRFLTLAAIVASFLLAVLVRILDFLSYLVLAGILLCTAMIVYYGFQFFWQQNGHLVLYALSLLSGLHLFFVVMQALLISACILWFLFAIGFLLNSVIESKN